MIEAAKDRRGAKRPCDAVEGIAPFAQRIPDKAFAMTRPHPHTMQLNIGKVCNLACKHCHIDAGPNRTEVMPRAVFQTCLDVLEAQDFATADITGGAPEMNPDFEWFIDELHRRGIHTIVRSNLAILERPAYEHLVKKYADYGINVVASLPADTERECDSQRGAGTFRAVIDTMRKLNALGYGTDPRLQLDLVYNPRGAFLPPSQAALEKEYRQKLADEYGIAFNNLFTFTNNPIGRFGAWLERSGNMDRYMHKLSDSFNPSTCEGMMCRDQIMVDWTGKVYDCDFNIVCDLPSAGIDDIGDLLQGNMEPRRIRFAQHCYACCAGAGSS